MPQNRNNAGQFQPGGGFWTGLAGDSRLKRAAQHGQWKGDAISYSQLHRWARKQFGNPKFCWLCERNGCRIEMACINHIYTRSQATWAALCVRCHRILDSHPYLKNDVRKRQAVVKQRFEQSVPVASIAYELGVSARTIQRDLQTLGLAIENCLQNKVPC